MIRLISLISLFAVVPALLSSPVSAQTPALRPAVIVSGEIVTLGDLLANAGTKAGAAVFRAPDLGQTGHVATQDIIDAAAAHGMRGIDTSGIPSVAVTRASRTIHADEIRAPLMAALAISAGLDDPNTLQVELDPSSTEIELPVEAEGAIGIADAVWQKERSSFDATLVVRRKDGREERRAIRGRAEETITVLVTRRALARGAVVTPDDVAVEHKPKALARGETLDDAAVAIGKEVRRALREGQAVRGSDLSEPTLVKSNSTVTIVLKSGGLTLTATAQALGDGKRGESIQVMNVQSKRVLQAVVTGENEVAVNPPRTLVSAAVK